MGLLLRDGQRLRREKPCSRFDILTNMISIPCLGQALRSSKMQDLLAHPGISPGSFPRDFITETLMQQCSKVSDASLLPSTGLGQAVEHDLSSIFISPTHCLGDSLYGTRSQTLVTAWGDNSVNFHESTVQAAEHGCSPSKKPVNFELEVPMAASWKGVDNMV